MGYLRLLRTADSAVARESDCLDAFDRELDYLFVLLQRFGAMPVDIDDLLQDIFVILQRNWPTLDMTRPLRPWLFGVTLRVVKAHRRKRSREVLKGDVDPGGEAESAEVGMEEQQSIALIWSALETIPDKRRSVLVMHELEGVEVADIARQLGITKIGVYTRLYKGRKELASSLRRIRRLGP